MERSRKAGLAIAASLSDRVQQLAAESDGGSGGAGGRRAEAAAAASALVGQRLDACLHFQALLAGAGCEGLPAALLLGLPALLPLTRHTRGSTRRLALEACSALLPSAAALQPRAEGTQASRLARPETAEPAQGTAAPAAAATRSQPPSFTYVDLLLAALLGRLADKDATLRGKALALLERHAALLARHFWRGTRGGDATLRCLPQALAARLRDRSPSVRKRAAALLEALLRARLPQPAAAALAASTLPVAAGLLSVRPDSALRPTEDAAKVVCLMPETALPALFLLLP